MKLDKELTFRLNTEQYDFIRALAKVNGVSVATIIRNALNKYINVGE